MPNRRFRFGDLCSRLCDFIARRRWSLPVALTLNFFFAPLTVFCLGIFLLHSCILRGRQDHHHVAAVLERAPHYPPAIKLLGQLALIAGDREAGCTYLTAYDVLFRGASTLHEELLARCDERERRAAAARVPSPRYEVFPLAGADAR